MGRHMITSVMRRSPHRVPCSLWRVSGGPLETTPSGSCVFTMAAVPDSTAALGSPQPRWRGVFSCWNMLFVPRSKGAVVTLLTCILFVCFRGPREASRFGGLSLLSRLSCCRKGWRPRWGARGCPAGPRGPNPHLIQLHSPPMNCSLLYSSFNWRVFLICCREIAGSWQLLICMESTHPWSPCRLPRVGISPPRASSSLTYRSSVCL